MDEIARQCTATNRDGIRCQKPAMLFQRVCANHGGKSPLALKAAAGRKLALVEPAIDVLWRAVRSTPKCEVCGRSDADRDPVALRAAQVILDRTGHGPSATLAVENVRHEPPDCVRWLSTQQLHTIAQWYAEAQQRMDRGEPEVGGNARRLLDGVPVSLDGVTFINRVIVDPNVNDAVLVNEPRKTSRE